LNLNQIPNFLEKLFPIAGDLKFDKGELMLKGLGLSCRWAALKLPRLGIFGVCVVATLAAAPCQLSGAIQQPPRSLVPILTCDVFGSRKISGDPSESKSGYPAALTG